MRARVCVHEQQQQQQTKIHQIPLIMMHSIIHGFPVSACVHVHVYAAGNEGTRYRQEGKELRSQRRATSGVEIERRAAAAATSHKNLLI